MKKKFNSNIFFTKNSIYGKEVFTFPKITISIPLKFTPKSFELESNFFKNFFIYSLKAKELLFFFFNTLPKTSKFYFYNISLLKDKVNFKKRKNIYFNLEYKIIYENYFLSLINLFTWFFFFKKFLEKTYFPKKFYINFHFSKKIVIIYILNFHWFLAFITNTNLTSQDYLFKFVLDFSDTNTVFYDFFFKFLEKKLKSFETT